jgi:tetratricopeptide (TPR) repeat protein
MKHAKGFLSASLVVLALALPATAEEVQRPQAQSPPASSPAAPGKGEIAGGGDIAEAARIQLDRLFERLAAAEDEEEANGIAQLIERRWGRSGSDTADLLMSRALAAASDKDPALAIEILDRVIVLEPKWAEAWNKRATLFFMMGDYERAIFDVHQTLALEPRHFGAWAGLGFILQSTDDNKHALEAFRRALAIHPFVGNVRSLIERLAPDVDGREL